MQWICLLPLPKTSMLLVEVHCNDGLVTCISLLLALSGIAGPHVWKITRCGSHLVMQKHGQPHSVASVELSSSLPTFYVSVKHLDTHISTADVTKYPGECVHCHRFPGNRPWVLLWQRLWTLNCYAVALLLLL